MSEAPFVETLEPLADSGCSSPGSEVRVVQDSAAPLRYKPRPRPEWVRGANAMGRVIDAGKVVLLDEESLLRSATLNTGLSDFGDDDWREPFRILLDDLERTADLNLVGRLLTRSDLLIHLEGRLRVIDWFKRHPEVEDEVIEAPVFVVGLPRSGTTIMEEIRAPIQRARGDEHVDHRIWHRSVPVAPGDNRNSQRLRDLDGCLILRPCSKAVHLQGMDPTSMKRKEFGQKRLMEFLANHFDVP